MTDMKYKGYLGSTDVDVQDNILHGKLLFIKDLVTYEASTPSELKVAFEEAVDDYLADCVEQGVEPDVPFKGLFNVRVAPELHRQLAVCARSFGKTMNEYVAEVLRCHDEMGENGQVKAKGEQQFILLAGPNANTSARAATSRAVVSTGHSHGASGWVSSGSTNAKH